VINYLTPFEVRVNLKHVIIEDSLYCDIVHSELQIEISNQVGIDTFDGNEDFLDMVEEGGGNITRNLMQNS
jgi:hypothetical protein